MIPVWNTLVGELELRYVTECLASGWIGSLGPHVRKFEEAFRAWLGTGADHAVACSSGTAGLHLALEGLEVGPGDEVIVPDLTLIACAAAVLRVGATPVLVDVDGETGCIDPWKIEEKVTSKTRAVLAVHLYGHPCDMDAIRTVTERYRLKLVEDACEAHGAEYRGRKVGAIGDVGVFSFYGNKILSTGEGGMVVCRDLDVARRMRLYRNQGFEEPRFVHQTLGWNYRLSGLQAAVGLAQLERVDEVVSRKRAIAARYRSKLEGVPGIRLLLELPWAKSVFWMIGVILEGPARSEIRRDLLAMGIDTRSFFYPLHLQPVFQKGGPNFPDVSGSYPNSRMLGTQGFYLPSGPTLKDSQVDAVVEGLKRCLA